MADAGENCGACRFWSGPEAVDIGNCKRHAPAYVEKPFSNEHEHKGWPRTWGEDRCGDFEARG